MSNGTNFIRSKTYTGSNGEIYTDSRGKNYSVHETIVEETGMGDGTTYSYINMEGFRTLSLQLIVDGGSGTLTATIEMTLQNDGTARTSCSYVDITSTAFGTASYTSTSMLVDDTGFFSGAQYVRVKSVVSGASNDAALTIYSAKIS